jgi:ribosomal protein L18E
MMTQVSRIIVAPSRVLGRRQLIPPLEFAAYHFRRKGGTIPDADQLVDSLSQIGRQLN